MALLYTPQQLAVTPHVVGGADRDGCHERGCKAT